MAYIRCGMGLAMFVGVRGWRCSNGAKHIGEKKVRGSIQEGGEFILFRFSRFWPVGSW